MDKIRPFWQRLFPSRFDQVIDYQALRVPSLLVMLPQVQEHGVRLSTYSGALPFCQTRLNSGLEVKYVLERNGTGRMGSVAGLMRGILYS